MPVSPTTDARPDSLRLGWLWSALICAVAALTLAYPALAGGFLVNPFSDQYIAGYAFREFAARSLRAGDGFPLWNPYLFAGVPFVAGMGGDIFYPTFLLRMLMPTDQAMTWGFIIHVWLCGVLTYAFLRVMGVGFFGSLVGGLAYMMSGQVASLVSPGHDGKLFISALFPLVLLLIHRAVRRGRLWSYGALAVTIGLGALSPHPQLLQYLLVASGAFALFAAFAALPDGRLERRVATRRLAGLLGAVVLGAMIGAIQFLPVFEYVPWSPRAGGLPSYERATSYSMPPEELVNTYLPQFSGILAAYWGRNAIHLHSEYLGATVLLLAGAGLGARTDRRLRPFLFFWVATGLIALLWALGGFTPFYRLVYAIVPGTKFFRAPSTIFFIVAFVVAVLAAFGTERAIEGRLGTRFLAGWLAAATAVVLFAMAGSFQSLALSVIGEQRFEAIMENSGAVTAGAWRSLGFVLATAGLLAARHRRRVTPSIAGWALAAIVVADLWSVLRHYWMFSAPAAQLYATDPVIEYLKNRPEPGRILALELGPPEAVHDPYFNGDAFMIHGIRDARGYHGNELGRYDILGGKESGWRVMLTSPRFWELMNVQYFLTNVPELPIEGSVRLLGPVRNSAGSTVYLFRLPGENPFAWVAPVIVKASDEVVLATLSDSRFDDVRRAALFDTSAAVTTSATSRSLPPVLPLTVATTRPGPGHITLVLSAPAPSGAALVVSENYYPGWRATSAGRELRVGRANFTVMGVELPAGATRVDLTFHSPAYERGKLITLCALGAALILAAGGLLVDRRRRG